ncbi:MBL fold metallo-hydrolase [Reyranella sp.]|uniref:MBL fold metallo-hydrolase n=1 Tax=Reyranella sp. TaxID=1929291 RepID=UPI003D0C893B
MSHSSTVTFLNHSCISISSATTTILCDPWFTGAAFDGGWRLLFEDSHDLDTIAFDWIWLSHEHPDHFSLPTLKQLKRPSRFIYQAAPDGKVRAYLQAKGHEVREVDDWETVSFGDITCQVFTSDGYDSAALFTLPDGFKVLNLNDCRAELDGLIERIAKDSGPIDLLTIQFSYANWAGNVGDDAIPRYLHEQVVARMEMVIATIKPKATLLFASYVYFSHDENFHWNAHFWADEVASKLAPSTKLILPKPNQVIHLEALDEADFSSPNETGLAFWTELHSKSKPIDHAQEHLTLEQLRAEFARFHAEIWHTNDLSLARSTSCSSIDLNVKITDLGQTVHLDLYEGTMTSVVDDTYDIAVSSEVLKFLLLSKFGRGTLTINGRAHFNYRTAYRFFVFFFIYYANNIGKRLTPDGGLKWENMYSVAKTVVLDSIFHTTPGARLGYEKFMKDFLRR